MYAADDYTCMRTYMQTGLVRLWFWAHMYMCVCTTCQARRSALLVVPLILTFPNQPQQRPAE